MKHNNSVAPSNHDYSKTVNAALGLTESRNEELHNKLNDAVEGMKNSGEHLTPGSVLGKVKDITTDATEAALLGYTISETFNAMRNPMAALAAMMKGEGAGVEP